MGLLTRGKPLSWQEVKKYAEHVRKHGIIQFINLYRTFKDKQYECLRWGDEIEYMFVCFDHENEKVRVALRSEEILKALLEREVDENNEESHGSLWHPETGAYMIESIPGTPYGIANANFVDLSHINVVEKNMRHRREEVEKLLGETEALLCLTSFPRLGCPNFSCPTVEPEGSEGATGSIFFPDKVYFGGHPRFLTLAENTRLRRGRKVTVNIPIFKDVLTEDPFKEIFFDDESNESSLPDHIYMDSVGNGMGCCCLQVTFQASNLEEARILYDQLTPLCPILMALTAASPIQRGYLSDHDSRWSVVSQCNDDRTKEELGEEPLKYNKYRIPKSRCDSIDLYISEEGSKYNDIYVNYNEEYYEQMVASGVDAMLAKHIAHLYIRDPLTLYKENIYQDDEKETDHLENILSTNWTMMKLKTPSYNSSVGWRVEFRPMDVQFTEFENAAFAVFVMLLTRVTLTYGLNFLIPISKVDENVHEAQKRDAIRKSKFWFRNDFADKTLRPEIIPEISEIKPLHDSCNLMSIDEIINGNSSNFPGLVPLLHQYLLSTEIDVDTHCTIQRYLNLIANRASGKTLTNAAWIRCFVQNHEEYKMNSVVNEKMNYDLIKTIDSITKGEVFISELHGDCRSSSPRFAEERQ